jgi:hypothetical protein
VKLLTVASIAERDSAQGNSPAVIDDRDPDNIALFRGFGVLAEVEAAELNVTD